jgi:hypothetical protein
MKSERTLDERIAAVERRLALRRERTVRHLEGIRAGVARRSRWMPLVAAGAALAFGIVAARRRTSAALPVTVTAATVRRTGPLATATAIVATALRVAMSPQARALWNAWNARRHPDFR